MPTAPTYAPRIPSALDTLRDSTDALISRQQVEDLLGVGKRTANGIIDTAGAVKLGTANMVQREDLIRFLEHFGFDDGFEAERQRAFAARLTKMRAEFLSAPRLLVDVEKVDPQSLAKANKRRLGGLPDGVILERGRITIQNFSTGIEALEKLALLAMAISGGLEEFEERVNNTPERKTA